MSGTVASSHDRRRRRRRVQLFPWIILLLVGLNFATPDPIDVASSPIGGSIASWTDLDDDDGEHSPHHLIVSQAGIPFPCNSLVSLIVLVGLLPIAGSSPNPQQPPTSFRIPRSPPAS